MAKAEVSKDYIKEHSTDVEVPDSYTCADIYALIVAGLQGVIMLPFLLSILVLYIIPVLLIRLYVCVLPRPLDRVPRTCVFYAFCFLIWVLTLPIQIITLIWVLLVRITTWLFSFPMGLYNFSRTQRSWKALSAFNKRPGQMTENPQSAHSPADVLATKHGYGWSFVDIVCAIMGSMDRQGCCEFFMAVPLMLTVVPIYKHTVLTNALLFDLQECFINQWSNPVDATFDGKADATDAPKVKVAMDIGTCRALLKEKKREILDGWTFTGYHQHPPPERESKTVAGMQFANNGPLRIALLSHTTITRHVADHVPKSETAAWSLMVVRLQSWNPFYQLAGIVEVNFRKDGGLEHPMWLMLDPKSKIAAGSMRSINELFCKIASWLPEFVNVTANDSDLL